MTNSEKATRSTVEELLLDAGHADAPELRAYLLSLSSLADLPLPAPGAELASMLAGSVDELARKRPLRKHRPTVVSVAVIAGMGLGVSGVAATSPNPGIRQGLVSIQNFEGGWAPALAAPLGGASVPVSAAPATPDQSFQGRSLAEPDSGPYAAELAEDAPAGWVETAQLGASAPAGGSRAMRGGSSVASAGVSLDGAKNGTGLAAVKPRGSGRHVALAGPLEKGQDNKAPASGKVRTEEAGHPGADGQGRGTILQRAAVRGVPFWDASLDLGDWLAADGEALAEPSAAEPGAAEPGAAEPGAALHVRDWVVSKVALEPVATEPVVAEPAATPQGHGKRAATQPAATHQVPASPAAPEPAALQRASPAAAHSALPAAAPPAAVVPAQDNSAKKSSGSAPGRLPSGRHFSQTPPPQSVASVADSVGTWLKKNHR
ncbi:hypothetical protein [Arthrobacter sp.]|uniref:hypothetical protein n=1 Tax=Arthrobacter sp. TaxID=1667 RepID=UPI002811F56D|nr:hypothetical protein [Arthrobacter sp.]